MLDQDNRPRFDNDPTPPKLEFVHRKNADIQRDSAELLQQSSLHFKEAISTAATDHGHPGIGTEYTIHSLVSITEVMADAGIPPVPVLKKIQEIHKELPKGTGIDGINERAWNNFALADMYGMLGEHEKMRRSIATSQRYGSFASPYIHAAEKQVRESEDPTAILSEALTSMSENHWGQIAEYAQIARLLQRAVQDPTPALSQAEEEVKYEQQDSKTFSDSSIHELAAAYARSGFFDDAMRMIELVGEDTESHQRQWFESAIP